MTLDSRTVMWRLLTMGMAAGAGAISQRSLAFAWSKAFGQSAATDPADRSTPWPEALVWGISTGVGFGVARLLANRSAATVWELAMEEPAPSS